MCKRGEIWLVNIQGNDKSMQYGIRPAIISSNNLANHHSPVIHVIPTTSRTKSGIPTHVEIGMECGLLKPSIALIEQEARLSKEYLIKKIGNCTDKAMKEVEKAILIQKGIIKPFVDMNIINRKIERINDLDRYINKQRIKGGNYDIELFDKTLIMAELIAYCKDYNIDYNRFFNKSVRKTERRIYLKEAL